MPHRLRRPPSAFRATTNPSLACKKRIVSPSKFMHLAHSAHRHQAMVDTLSSCGFMVAVTRRGVCFFPLSFFFFFLFFSFLEVALNARSGYTVKVAYAWYNAAYLRGWLPNSACRLRRRTTAGLRWDASWDVNNTASLAAITSWLGQPAKVKACKSDLVFPPPGKEGQ